MARPAARAAALYGTAVAVVGADQLSKYLVVRQLAGRPPLRLVGSFVELRYTTNSGGAFSLLTGAPLFFAVTAIVIVAGIVYAGRRTRGVALLVPLGLVLGGALATHRVERRYLALVQGRLPGPTGTVDAPLGRHPRDRKRMAVVTGGRRAVSHWRVLETFPAVQ